MEKQPKVKLVMEFTPDEYEALKAAASGAGFVKVGSGHVQRLIRSVLAGRMSVAPAEEWHRISQAVGSRRFMQPVELADVRIGNPGWPKAEPKPVKPMPPPFPPRAKALTDNDARPISPDESYLSTLDAIAADLGGVRNREAEGSE